MKFSKRSTLFLMIGGPICFLSIILGLAGVAIWDYHSFAVGNDGLIYVGVDDEINVYDEGEFVETIFEGRRGAWLFTIRDEKLYLATNSRVKIMDLSGNLIKEYDDDDWILDSEYHKLDEQKNSFITEGAKYNATNVFGFYMITKYSNDGSREIVYHIPIVDFIFYTIRWVFLVLLPIIFLKEYVKMGK